MKATMRSMVSVYFILGIFVFTLQAQHLPSITNAVPQITDKNAEWSPREGSLTRIRGKCSSLQSPALGECFVAGMQGEGASPQAVSFTKRTGSLAYMTTFLETGTVDVAYIEKPFRANENSSWLLVNGVPDFIDIDDPMFKIKTGYEKDTRYASLLKTYPKLALWPDDSTSQSAPVMKGLRGKGQRFIVNYRITDGCRACKNLGTASFAFDFDQSGKYLGTKFFGIENTPRQSRTSNQPETVEQGFTNPKRPVEKKTGQKFTIVLGANHTTGYRWKLADEGDKSIVELVGSEYKVTDDGRIGSGGREVWTFLGKSPGKTKISFQYARPWEKQANPKTTSFEISIQQDPRQ